LIGRSSISQDAVTVVRYGREIAAIGTEDRVFFTRAISVLERDHPRRRFVAVVALVGRQMAVEPEPEPYDQELAEFYARILVMPNDEFEFLSDIYTDAELAEHFNVPLEQVIAKREDVRLEP
jgi:hypothetical protein